MVNIGRADFNDVVIADPSVSTSHAKLQRRDDVWMLTDLGSTNGTFVEGERLSGEVALGPGTTVKFGEVAVLFEPLDETVPIRRSSGTQVLSAMLPSRRPAERAADRSGSPRGTPRPRRPIRAATPRAERAAGLAHHRARAGRSRSRPTSFCADRTGSRALHLRRSHRHRHRPLRQRGQLPHARRARRLHRRRRDGRACGRRGGERDGGPDHLAARSARSAA